MKGHILIMDQSAQGSLFGSFNYNILTNDMFDLIDDDDDVEIYDYGDDNTILNSGICLKDIKKKL